MAVTRIGVISALGMKTAEFWRALQKGESGIRAIEAIDAEQLRFKNVAQVRGFFPEAQFERGQLACMARFAQFAVLSAGEAIAHANVEWTPLLREKAIVVTGSCMGGGCAEQDGYRELFLRATSHVHPLTSTRYGQCGYQPNLHVFRNQRPSFYDLDRVCLFGTCLGPSILDGSLRAGATRCRRRK